MATELTDYGREQILRQIYHTPDEHRQVHGLSALIDRSVDEVVNGFNPRPIGENYLDRAGAAVGITRRRDVDEPDEVFRDRIRAAYRRDFHPLEGGIRPGELYTIGAYTGHGRNMLAENVRRAQTPPTADAEGTPPLPPVPHPSPETRRSIIDWIRQSDHFKSWTRGKDYLETMNSGPTAKEMEEDYRV